MAHITDLHLHIFIELRSSPLFLIVVSSGSHMRLVHNIKVFQQQVLMEATTLHLRCILTLDRL